MASKLEPPPFVGPRPLRTGELLAGRGAEVQQLCDELIARRVVVLHSVAGAGKSSLINAGLVPALRKAEFDVWRPIVLQANVDGLGELPAETNPYVLSAMLCLEDELPARARRGPAALAQLSFGDYVAGRPRRKRFADRNVALVFDDLDDLLTTAGEAQRRDFFAAIGNTLENPKLWALLVVRDELLAKLTLHHRQVPTRMANIFHLERFRPDSAARVIEALAAQGERRFDDVGALVTKLVALDDGRGELDAAEDGTIDLLALQVVCRQLWAAAPEGDEGIDVDAFELGTSVSTVLGRYYGRVLRTLVEGDVEAEREIRLQVAATMAPGGRRVRVRRERVELGDAAVKRLRGFGLVDLYEYAGGEWLSLAHARLAEPIVASDAQWLRAHSPTVSKVKGLLPGWSKRGQVEVGEHSVELEGMSWSEPPREASDEPSWLLSLTDLDGKPVVEAATSTMTTVSNPTASTPEALAQRQLARRLLEIDEAGNEARLAVALISLAQADSRWRAAARTAEGLPLSLDDLLELLLEQLPWLAGPPPVVSVDNGGPDLADLIRALLDLGEALARARGPGKRGLLLAGFHAGLRQGNLALGMSRMLWDLSCRLEAPEVRVLEILAMDDDVVEPVSIQRDPFLLVRLRELNLVESRADGGWRASSLGRRLLEFVHGWDEDDA